MELNELVVQDPLNIEGLLHDGAPNLAGDAPGPDEVVQEGVSELTSGDAADVVAGGATVGICFRGEGALEYVSADPVEFPVLHRNVRKNTGLLPDVAEKSVTLRDRFTEVFWLAGSTPMPQLPAEREGRPLGGRFSARVKMFGRVEATPVEHMFASWRLNAPGRPFVRAEISGGNEDLLHHIEGSDKRRESLCMVKGAFQADVAISDRLYRTVLSDQPIGRDRRDPVPPPFLLTGVDLSVTATDGENLTMTATETFRAFSGTSRVLRLDLHNTRFGYNRLGGLGPHALRFPQPDLSGQDDTVHCAAKVKKPFVPFAPGKTVRRVTEGDFNVVELHAWGFGQAPPGFMFITSEAFNPIGGEVNRLFSGGVNERFSHEIAHQYWGHAVKMPSGEEQWLTKSFAEISAGLCIRDRRGKGDLDLLQKNWTSQGKSATESAPIPLANRLRSRSGGSPR